MTLHGQKKVVLTHAATIIDNGDARFSAMLDFDIDTRCASINCIFNYFFDNGSRPLNHFACGDPVHRAWRQPADAGRVF